MARCGGAHGPNLHRRRQGCHSLARRTQPRVPYLTTPRAVVVCGNFAALRACGPGTL